MISGIFKGEIFGGIINFVVIAGGVLLFFIVVELVRGQREVETFLNIVCISVFIVSLYGLLQVFIDIKTISLPGLTELYGSPEKPQIELVHGHPQVIAGRAWQKNTMWSWQSNTSPVFIGTKIFSTFHHGNVFGNHLITFLPLVITMALTKKKRFPSILLFFLSILGGINILFTNSRGALAGILVGIMVMIFLRRRYILPVISIGLIIYFTFLMILSEAVIHKRNITGVNSSVYLLFYEARYTDLFRHLLLLPRDRGRWVEINALSNQRISRLKIALENVFLIPSTRQLIFGSTFKLNPDLILHNYFISIIYKIGLLGFGLFCSVLILLFKTLFSSIRDTPQSHIIIGGIAGLVAALAHNIIDAPFYYPPLAFNFWILSGFMLNVDR